MTTPAHDNPAYVKVIEQITVAAMAMATPAEAATYAISCMLELQQQRAAADLPYVTDDAQPCDGCGLVTRGLVRWALDLCANCRDRLDGGMA